MLNVKNGVIDLEKKEILEHNPEYYLKYAKREKIHLEKARNEYLSRIKKAFEPC